jgi:hypothetical protein
MSKILLAGDSWGIGVFSGAGGTYGPTGQGIQTILEAQGHTVINISKGGGANWLMVDRLEGRWYNTGRCLFGADYKDKVDFDLNEVDHILFLQTDICRERHYYGKQNPSDEGTTWKILDRAFINEIMNFDSLTAVIDYYFNKLYAHLNSIAEAHNKKITLVGGWSQLHPSVINYPNLIAAVPSATKLLIPSLKEDVYLSDPEWYVQLGKDTKFMVKFGSEFKPMSILAAEKLDLIYKNWHEVHPDIAGYQKIVDAVLPFWQK